MATTKKNGRSEAQKRADAKYEAKRRGSRHHNWNAIVYPESAPENWRDILCDCMIQWWASPLHDLDANPDGQKKKEHYHVDISFHAAVTYETAKDVFDQIGAVMPPKNPPKGSPRPYVVDLRGSLRYFCHMDNPSKAQYAPMDATYGGGATPYIDLIASASDDDEMICEIEDFCDQYDIASYARLSRYVRKYRPEWRRIVLRTGAVPLSRYLRSVGWERTHGYIVSGDNLGEIAPDMALNPEPEEDGGDGSTDE